MNWLKRKVRFTMNVLKIVRAVFVLWLLEKLTHEERVPLTTYGRFKAMEGDIVILNGVDGGIELGKIVATTTNFKAPPTVHLRLFRRPK